MISLDEMIPDLPKGHMLNAMLVLATNRHSGQFDRGGNPYVLHVLKVMHYLKSDDEELNCIAIGHDIIEDTKTSYAELRELGMSERVIDGIAALTKVPGETYEEYKDKVKANLDARKVKMADLKHNSNIDRLKGVTEKDLTRMEKYHRFYMELKILENPV